MAKTLKTAMKTTANGAAVRERVKKIIGRLDKEHPDAKLALDYANALELLIALILAAQSHDSLVNQITPALFAKYKTAKDYADAPRQEIFELVRRINFAGIKSGRIKGCCEELVKSFKGEVPWTLEELVTLPGVGRKPPISSSATPSASPASASIRTSCGCRSASVSRRTPIPTRSSSI